MKYTNIQQKPLEPDSISGSSLSYTSLRRYLWILTGSMKIPFAVRRCFTTGNKKHIQQRPLEWMSSGHAAGPAPRRSRSLNSIQAVSAVFIYITIFIISSLGLHVPKASADGNRGLTIAQEAQRRDSGWRDSKVKVTMVLRRADGREVKRHLRIRSIEVDGDGDKSLTIFDRPKDIKGTAFLSYTHKTGHDDQWLYLPTLRRVKRISSNNRSGPFVGSEFAYEDIASEEVERYTYTFLREEACREKMSCFVIERYPIDKTSGYTKQIVWLDTKAYRTMKIQYFDRKGQHIKTLQRHNYQQVAKNYWRAMRWDMQNIQTGKSTTVLWEDYQLQVGLSEIDFDRGSLKRAR